MGPSWGTSCFLSMLRIWSRLAMPGDRPPCTQNTELSMSAARLRGRQGAVGRGRGAGGVVGRRYEYAATPEAARVSRPQEPDGKEGPAPCLAPVRDWPDSFRQCAALARERAAPEVVEDVCAVPPDVGGAVLAQTLVVEAVDLCDLPALVVSPDQEHAVRVPHLWRRGPMCTRVRGVGVCAVARRRVRGGLSALPGLAAGLEPSPEEGQPHEPAPEHTP